MTTTSQRLAFAFLIVAAALVLASSAGAQFAGGHSAFDQRPGPEAVQFRDFFWGDRRPSYPNNSFDPFGGDRRSTYPNSPFDPYSPSYRRPQVYEATKPPAPRKVETPSTETVVVIGDSLADWLGYGLEQVFAETPEIGIVRKIKPDFGLARDDARLDAPEWLQVIKDLLATEKPSAIVVMLGVNDRLPLRDRAPAVKGTAATTRQRPSSSRPIEAQRRPQGANSEFHTDKWAELYSKRIDDMIAALKTKGVPIVWVGLPAIRGTKSTSDMSYLDELYRARAEKAGITYVDIWDGFVDEQGRYTQQGPDFEGQTRRLRTYDGVNFTKAGAEKLGHYVEQDLRRVWISHVLPVALPGPEEQTPAKGATVVPPPSVRSFLSMRSAIRAATFWAPQALWRNGQPIRSLRACSTAATRLRRRPVALTISPGRAPTPKPATPRMSGRLRPRPPTVRSATTVQKTKIKKTRTRPRQKRINRDSRSCSRLRTISRPPSRSVPATERPVSRPCRSAPLFQIQGEERFSEENNRQDDRL